MQKTRIVVTSKELRVDDHIWPSPSPDQVGDLEGGASKKSIALVKLSLDE